MLVEEVEEKHEVEEDENGEEEVEKEERRRQCLQGLGFHPQCHVAS